MARKKTPPAPSAPTPLTVGVGGSLLLAALILVYLLLAFGYSAVTPAATADQHNPDENAHLQYVATLASGHLPVFTDAEHGYENHQPPLYYALCVPAYLAAHGHGDAAATRAVRGVSMLLGALLILVTYRCIKTLLPDEPAVALGAAAFVGLLPGSIALCASVTNDALTNLVMATGLWLLTRCVVSGRVMTDPRGATRQAAWLGLVLGLGLWTKTSTLLLFPVVLFAAYGLARQKLLPAPDAARFAFLSLGLGLLVGSPWLARNTLLYGDPVAQRLFVSAFSHTAQADVITRALFGGSIGDYLWGVAQWTFASFWGGFDSGLIFWGQNPLARLDPNTRGAYGIYAAAPPVVYLLPLALGVLAVVGIVLGRRAKRLALSPAQSVFLATFALLVLLNGFVFLRFILTFFQAQGRYLYPALLPLAFFFVWGWRGLLPPRAFPVFVGLMTGGLIALNVYTIFGLLGPRFSSGILP